jgi:hypothetical protein
MKASLLPSLLVLAMGASASGQEPTAPSQARERRIRILVNGLYNPSGIGFSETSTFTSFVEEGQSTRTYDGGKGIVFEVGAIVGIRKGLGVMGTLELYQSDFDAGFEESVPHPLYFDQPRTVSGDVPGLEYSENVLHLDAVYTREFPKFTLDVFGGPSFFFTNTEILNTVNTASDYPFDELTVTSTSNSTIDDNPIGFNAGGALTFRLNDVVGIAVQARYSHASLGIAREGGEEIDLDAGGFRLGGGIRLSF